MNLMIWGRLCWFSHPDTVFPLANSLPRGAEHNTDVSDGGRKRAVTPKGADVIGSSLSDVSSSAVPNHAQFLCADFESAVRLAALPPLADIIETIWILGGTKVYEDALKHPWCDLLYLTDVMADFDCDVFFPDFDRELFQVQDEFPDVPGEVQEENGIKFKCQVFKRVTVEEQ
ncbi:Viral dihydrofolate reductase [Oryzias melastigma]|uniref:dihydrofolate reductase n=1 Tax=Oryzias melastigma TaxID=30732 RepID=A0A834F729_ORYME|nr:Viral dihydrofolate reductase [Oryzias melastigma]